MVKYFEFIWQHWKRIYLSGAGKILATCNRKMIHQIDGLNAALSKFLGGSYRFEKICVQKKQRDFLQSIFIYNSSSKHVDCTLEIKIIFEITIKISILNTITFCEDLGHSDQRSVVWNNHINKIKMDIHEESKENFQAESTENHDEKSEEESEKVTDDGVRDNKENKDENMKDQSAENKDEKSEVESKKVTDGGGGDSSDDDDRVGVIRIRDFGSLREQDSSQSDEEDEVMEVPVEAKAPRSNTIRVPMDEKTLEVVSLEMECEVDESIARLPSVGEQQRVVRQKILSLQEYLKTLSVQGGNNNSDGGIPVLPTTRIQQIPNTNNFNRVTGINLQDLLFNQSGKQTYPPAQQNNNVRLTNTTRNPISFIRARNVNPQTVAAGIRAYTARGPQTLGANNSGLANANQNMRQIIFDPTSGLIICPSSQGNINTQQLQATYSIQNNQGVQGVLTPQQIVSAANSGQISVTRQGVTINGMSATRIVQSRPVAQTNPSPSKSSPLSTYAIQPNRLPPASNGFIQMSSAFRSQNPGSHVLIAPRGQVPTSGNRNPVQSPMRNSSLPNIGRPPVPHVIVKSLAEMNQARRNPGQMPNIRAPTDPKNKPKPLPPSAAPPASASLPGVRNRQSHMQKVAAEKVQQQMAKTKAAAEVTAGTLQPLPGTNGLDKDANNRTFPSLVVAVKPCLQERLTKQQATAARSELDLRVKTMLMLTPSKFTEWMMREGLLKVDFKCPSHLGYNSQPIPFKLAMYSDGQAAKHPFSGGYVWVSDCCPNTEISVFQGSIFESSVYPPGTIIKLMYHWSCQTLHSNVIQWVKVTSYYLKNFYTLLRSTCVAALHENSVPMGGRGKFVEVGIITLGTTVPNSEKEGPQKQVKIEILGVFDPTSKAIRMKVINSAPPGTSQVTRLSQIFTPLTTWIDKSSVILIDSSVDKNILEQIGFANVSQCRGTSVGAQKTAVPTNVNVMNYLKNIVPKMFHNTLCVLSKSLIQQFLDELSWRERWGGTPALAFDRIIKHIVQMTKAETGENLISRLNRISLNPFDEWSLSKNNPKPATGIDCLPDSIRNATTPSITNFKRQQKTLGPQQQPIAMAKPVWPKNKLPPPPPAKKSKVSKANTPSVTTLNSALAVPLNPNEDFMYSRVNINITDVDRVSGFTCWECGNDVKRVGHFRGVMKCSKCKYETCCHFAITTHVKAHSSSERVYGPHRCKPVIEETLECYCGFCSDVMDNIATHLTTCEYKTVFPMGGSNESLVTTQML